MVVGHFGVLSIIVAIAIGLQFPFFIVICCPPLLQHLPCILLRFVTTRIRQVSLKFDMKMIVLSVIAHTLLALGGVSLGKTYF